TGGITVGGTATSTLLVSKTGDATSTALNAGNRVWTLSASNNAKPLNIDQRSGAISAGTSTFDYTGDNDAGDVTIENPSSYYNLTMGGSVAENYNPEGAITATNDLTMNANATLIGTQNIPVNGNVTGAGAVNLTGGTFEQDVP
ncbi:MAG: hypothetical protein AAB737_03195, partial [Patescibacteria group bacterium]